MGSDLPPPETSDRGHTPCVTHSSRIPLAWGEGERCVVHRQKLGPTLNGGWCLSMVLLLEERAHLENVIPRLKGRIPLTWGEGKRCRVRRQELGPTLNGGWCLSMVLPLIEGAHPKNMIPRLKDRTPPPATALNRPIQMETTAELP